ncbi:MAG: polyprenyl synthetase family protein [Clostridiaceae bacterium]
MGFWQDQLKLNERLNQIQEIMQAEVPRTGRFSAVLTPLTAQSGKMLRPALLVLSAGFSTSPWEVNHLAAALEFLHLASLIHDDIIDHGRERRGQPTVVRQHGTAMALYAGDYLIFLAARCLYGLEADRLPRLPMDFMGPLLEAEAEQLESRFSMEQTPAGYLARIEAKTGLLFSLASSAGFAVRQESPHDIEPMKRAGLDFGIAFQLRDDLADLSDSAYSDLREGNFTLPVIFALEEDPALKVELADLGPGIPDEAAFDRIVRRIEGTGAIRRTQAVIRDHLNRSAAVFRSHLGAEEWRHYEWMNQQLFGGYYEDQSLCEN